MLLIGGKYLVTRDEQYPLIENGGVIIEGTKILEVGNCNKLRKKYPEAQFMDAKNQIIMPGLINVHHHIYSSFARGLAIKNHNPKGFMDILEGLWWNLDRHLNMEDTKYSAIATYINSIENGVTTIFDHHASYFETTGSLRTIADVAKEYGVRTCLCYEVSDRNGEAKMKEAVKENVDFITFASNDKSDMVKGMMGLHASFTLSDKTLKYVVENTPKGAGYHVHIAEGIEDVEDSIQKYNCRSVERLEKMGILGNKSIAGHCIHINESEMDILKKTDTMVIHNPESNMGNAVGCPDVIKMFEKGILLGLGTDGYTYDMLESYKVANCLQKHVKKNPNVAWNEIPTMLFDNNRAIANRFFDTPLGMLKEGYAADIILVDYDAFTPLNKDTLNSHILFGMNGAMVTTTIINGVIVMKDRQLTQIKKHEVLEKCSEQAKDLWLRIHAER